MRNEKRDLSERNTFNQDGAVEAQHVQQYRHGVQLHIHPLVSLIVVTLLSFIGLIVFVVYAIAYHVDFVVSTLSLMHDGWFVVRVIAVLGVVWLALRVLGQGVIHVIHPMIDAIGKVKRHKVLAHTDNFVFVDSPEHGFYQISQDKAAYNYQGELNTSDVPEALLNAPVVERQAPSQSYALSLLRENMLEVCMGTSVETGNPTVQDLLGGTHYKLIGTSGMGKSCLAGSILDQATQANDPQHLQIALLDLEHKTSRLFENLPHVAELQVGRRRIECVATTPDEVGEHLGYLKMELDRRKALTDVELSKQRFILIYLEEFLSLKYEIDPKLLVKMQADFSILALRGRKYGLYFLACSQVDYAAKDESMKEAQNQFNAKGSFSVRPSAARAAGFNDAVRLKKNFETKQPGRFVYETTGVSDLLLAPDYDVRAKLIRLQGGSGSVQRPFSGPSIVERSDTANAYERTSEARSTVLNDTLNVPEDTINEILRLDGMGWVKQEIVEKLWNCTKGGSKAWQTGSTTYDAVMKHREQLGA